MQVKVLQATHPDMMVGLSTEKLRNYYRVFHFMGQPTAGDNQDYKDMDAVPTPTLL